MPLHDDKRPAQLETSEQPPSAIDQYYASKIQPELDALIQLLEIKKIKESQKGLEGQTPKITKNAMINTDYYMNIASIQDVENEIGLRFQYILEYLKEEKTCKALESSDTAKFEGLNSTLSKQEPMFEYKSYSGIQAEIEKQKDILTTAEEGEKVFTKYYILKKAEQLVEDCIGTIKEPDRKLEDIKTELRTIQRVLETVEKERLILTKLLGIKDYLVKSPKNKRNTLSTKRFKNSEENKQNTITSIKQAIESDKNKHGKKKRSTEEYLLNKLAVLRFEQGNKKVEEFIKDNEQIIYSVLDKITISANKTSSIDLSKLGYDDLIKQTAQLDRAILVNESMDEITTTAVTLLSPLKKLIEKIENSNALTTNLTAALDEAEILLQLLNESISQNRDEALATRLEAALERTNALTETLTQQIADDALTATLKAALIKTKELCAVKDTAPAQAKTKFSELQKSSDPLYNPFEEFTTVSNYKGQEEMAGFHETLKDLIQVSEEKKQRLTTISEPDGYQSFLNDLIEYNRLKGEVLFTSRDQYQCYLDLEKKLKSEGVENPLQFLPASAKREMTHLKNLSTALKSSSLSDLTSGTSLSDLTSDKDKLVKAKRLETRTLDEMRTLANQSTPVSRTASKAGSADATTPISRTASQVNPKQGPDPVIPGATITPRTQPLSIRRPSNG